MNATDRLTRLKAKIQTAENALLELKGEEKQLLKQLKEKFKCDSIENAEKLLSDLNTKVKDLEARLSESLINLEEAYDWDSI